MSVPENISGFLQSIFAEFEANSVIKLNENGVVKAVWGDLDFSALAIREGMRIDQCVPEFVGHPLRDDLTLPIVASPQGRYYALLYRAIPDGGLIVIRDQTNHALELRTRQQAAHDMALLLRSQSKMMQHLQASNTRLAKSEHYLSETNRLKSQFLATMAHELKTPLTSILGYAQLMAEKPRAEDDEKMVNAIQRGSRQLMTLLENMLDQNLASTTQIDIQLEPCDLNSTFKDIESMFDPLAQSAQLDFAVETNEQLPFVLTDEIRLRQVLVNIIGNAVKFTKVGHVHVHAEWQAGQLLVLVSDSGPGIEAEDMERIFEPYQRADSGAPGIGLGLAIVRQIVEAMGGHVELDSNLGVGTKIRFSIAADQIDQSRAEQQRGGMIALVEDDQDVADLVNVVLSDLGFDVQHFNEGLGLLDWMNVHSADLVITDLHLPGLTGIEIIAELRSRSYEGPIIVLSATSSTDDRRRAHEAGCSLFLKKPIHMVHLLTEVVRLIEQREDK